MALGGLYDNTDTALRAIIEEWSANRPYAERVDNLLTGHNGLPILDLTTVSDDGGIDQLFGLFGSNWFFAKLGEDITDAFLVDVVPL